MAAIADVPTTTRIYSAGGSFLCEFPQFVNLQVLDVLNDTGSFNFQWALNAPNASNLISDSGLQVAVCQDFQDGNGYTEVWRGLYEQDTYDSSFSESAIVQANGRGMAGLLDQAIVYPSAGTGSNIAYTSFSSANPGIIMNTLISAAQTRGCFPALGVSFTVGHDSSGNAWAQSYTVSYSCGTSLLTVLLGLAQAGLCDFSMSGSTLNMYNPNTTLGNDRSTTIFLRRSREVLQTPQQRDRTQIGTAVLAMGDNGVNVEVTNSGQIALLGRIERYLAQAGVNDTGTLTTWANQLLGAIDDQQIAVTPTYVGNVPAGTPMPWKNYKMGDYVSVDIGGQPIKYRVRQVTCQLTTGGPLMVQPTMNDIFYDQNLLVQGRLSALSNSIIGGPTQIANLPGPNSTIPQAAAFVTANVYTSAYYSPATGTTLAQLQLTWTTPTNTDGTPINDGNEYVVQYQVATVPVFPLLWSQIVGRTWASITGNPWSNALASPYNTQWTTVKVPFGQNSCTISGLICGETYNFQIATNDISGNQSPFSTSTPFVTAKDNVAPSTPDAPTVFASMVAVQVMSDLGKASGGTYNLEQDLDHLEVHYSYEPNFTAVPGVGSVTYLGKLIANAGMMAAGIAAVGTFQVTSTTGIYIRVLAVDESGNYGAASSASGVTAVLIDDQHISSLSVSKLIAGTIMATVILGSSIATASSGARVAMDGTTDALYTYDTGGNLIGVWAGKSGTDPSTSVAFNAGWSIFNDPSPGYVNVKSNIGSLSYSSPSINITGNAANSSVLASIYSLASATGAGSFELFHIDGPVGTLANDPNSSIANITLGSGSATDTASGILGFNDSSGAIRRLSWDKDGLFTNQGPMGSTIGGNVMQNTSGNGGLGYRYMHIIVTSPTMNGSGQATLNHGAAFTPVFAVASCFTGNTFQVYFSSFTSTQVTVTCYTPAGALAAGSIVSFWAIFIGY